MTADTGRAAARAELLAAAYAAYYKADDDADNDRLADALDAVLADTDTLAAATGLERPEDVTRGWADNWAMHYPADVFIPLDPNDVHAVHEAFRSAGLSVDAWTAHIMRHVCRVMRDDADRLARESRPATAADYVRRRYGLFQNLPGGHGYAAGGYIPPAGGTWPHYVVPARESGERPEDRCPSCEHLNKFHQPDSGCWFTVGLAAKNKNAVCPCARESRAATDTGECDHALHYVTEDDGRSHWRCLRCGQVIDPRAATDTEAHKMRFTDPDGHVHLTLCGCEIGHDHTGTDTGQENH